MEGFSDDEDADPTFIIPTPRVDVFASQVDEPDETDEEEEETELPVAPISDAVDEDQPSVPPVDRQPPIPPAPPVLPATWELNEEFDPLPPAPPNEPTDKAYLYSSIELFKKYIPDHLLDAIAECTSQNILGISGRVVPLTRIDVCKFIGITLMMSYLKYPRIKMYWAAETRVPQIADVMSRNQYFLIRNHLRCRDCTIVTNEEKGSNKYWRVAPILNSVRAGCLENERGLLVSMDEQMVPFWGHTQMRQHIKGKPNPCGLKNFVACAPDGLPLDFFFYEGKGDSILPADANLTFPQLSIAGKVIVRLTKNLPPGMSIYMDRYFTSVDLLDELHLMGYQGTGTLTLDKVPYNTQLYTDGELRGGGRGYFCQVVREGGQISIVKWFDNKPVILISSVHGAEPTDVCRRWSKKEKRYVDVTRPHVIKVYNECMGGVDMLDRMISFYRINARTKKWPVRVMFHMIDFVVAAGWLERRRKDNVEGTARKDRFDYLDFRSDLAYKLLNLQNTDDEDAMSVDEEPNNRPVWKKKTPLPHEALRKKASLHMPEWPADGKPSRCRLPGCKSPKCRIKCTTCNVFLCLNANRNCFKIFHER